MGGWTPDPTPSPSPLEERLVAQTEGVEPSHLLPEGDPFAPRPPVEPAPADALEAVERALAGRQPGNVEVAYDPVSLDSVLASLELRAAEARSRTVDAPSELLLPERLEEPVHVRSSAPVPGPQLSPEPVAAPVLMPIPAPVPTPAPAPMPAPPAAAPAPVPTPAPVRMPAPPAAAPAPVLTPAPVRMPAPPIPAPEPAPEPEPASVSISLPPLPVAVAPAPHPAAEPVSSAPEPEPIAAAVPTAIWEMPPARPMAVAHEIPALPHQRSESAQLRRAVGQVETPRDYSMVAPVELQFDDDGPRVGIRSGTRTYLEFQRIAGVLWGDLKRSKSTR